MSDQHDNSATAESESVPLDAPESGAVPGPEELASAAWDPQQVQDWKEQAAKAQEHWDRLLRISADFDNYRKRATRERQDAIRFANESLLGKLIPILDNFDAAMAAAGASGPDPAADALRTGVTMIYNQLHSTLAEAGLQEIDATGQPFDPNWHEAVAQQPSDTVSEGHVLQQLRKGYKLNDRLLRPASVVVAKKPTA